MQLTKINEFQNSMKTKYLLWIDNNLYGYVNNIDKARLFLSAFAEKICEEIKEVEPTWLVNVVNDNDVFTITCKIEGYVYNTCWTEHTIKYTTINQLKNTIVEKNVEKDTITNSNIVVNDVETVVNDVETVVNNVETVVNNVETVVNNVETVVNDVETVVNDVVKELDDYYYSKTFTMKEYLDSCNNSSFNDKEGLPIIPKLPEIIPKLPSVMFNKSFVHYSGLTNKRGLFKTRSKKFV